MLKLFIDRGSEGPAHDPYSYQEFTFLKEGLKVTIHLGLAEWIEINGKRTDGYDTNINDMFEMATGLSIKNFMKVYERINNPIKCVKCGCKEREYRTGFPGESFDVCTKCGEVYNYYFDESAII